MQMPQCSAGLPDDVFNRTCPFSLEVDRNNCLKRYESINYTAALYRPNWALTNYGAQFPTATNIVFRFKILYNFIFEFSIFKISYFILLL